MNEETYVTLDIDNDIARIRLNRPSVRNALAPRMLDEISAHCARLQDTPSVRVVVLEGVGSAFSVGFDLQTFGQLFVSDQPLNEAHLREAAAKGQRVIDSLKNLSATTIASVQGYAIGGGFLLAAACDFRIAEEDCTFSIPEVDIGIPLLWGGVPLLINELGLSRTRRLVISGARFYPHDLESTGFFHEVAPVSTRDAHVDALIASLLDKPPAALRAIKQQFIHAENACLSRDASQDEIQFVNAVLDPSFLPSALRYVQRRTGRHNKNE